mmetsp:Transcript_26042/g.72804  ORF Transcript_26042/g.72804 Transcript_26042/m.72804 type:complete len:282 (+) Transcript_26042:403-1248(+)
MQLYVPCGLPLHLRLIDASLMCGSCGRRRLNRGRQRSDVFGELLFELFQGHEVEATPGVALSFASVLESTCERFFELQLLGDREHDAKVLVNGVALDATVAEWREALGQTGLQPFLSYLLGVQIHHPIGLCTFRLREGRLRGEKSPRLLGERPFRLLGRRLPEIEFRFASGRLGRRFVYHVVRLDDAALCIVAELLQRNPLGLQHASDKIDSFVLERVPVVRGCAQASLRKFSKDRTSILLDVLPLGRRLYGIDHAAQHRPGHLLLLGNLRIEVLTPLHTH